MTGVLEIVFAVLLAGVSLSVFSCALLAARADRLMKPAPLDSDFEEA